MQQPTTIPVLQPPERPKSLVNKKGIRLDGRGINHFRNIFLKTGVIDQASGSAYMEVDQTKVICGVYGPKQTSKFQFSEIGKLNCDFKFASFSCKDQRRKFSQEKEEKEYSMHMVQALEVSVRLDKYPKSVIDIFALVLQSDGGALSCALTCASMALADAGIEMYDLVASCSAAKIDDQIILDPGDSEERFQSGGLTLALMPSLNEITQIFQSGEIEYPKTLEALQLCLDGCAKIYSLMTKSLVESSKKKLNKSSNISTP